MVLEPVQLPPASYCRDQDTLLPCPGGDASELHVAHIAGMFRDEGWTGVEVGNSNEMWISLLLLPPLWSVKVGLYGLLFSGILYYCTLSLAWLVGFGFGGQDLTM